MKKIILSLCLAQSLYGSDQCLPRFTSFMWGVTTTALIVGAAKCFSTPEKPDNSIAHILEEKRNTLEIQNRSTIMSSYIKGIQTYNNVDVRVKEGADVNQMLVTSNKLSVGNVQTYVESNYLVVCFSSKDTDRNHRSVITITTPAYFSYYQSHDNSRLEVSSPDKTVQNRSVELTTKDNSTLCYYTMRELSGTKINARNSSTMYIGRSSYGWEISQDRYASIYFNDQLYKNSSYY